MDVDKYVELGAIGLKLWNQNKNKDEVSNDFAETLCYITERSLKFLFVDLCEVISQIDHCDWKSLDTMHSFIEKVELSLPNFYDMADAEQKALSEIKKSIFKLKDSLEIHIVKKQPDCYSECDAEAFALWGLISDENNARIQISYRI